LTGQTAPAGRPFVPGEAIVRFKPGSEAAKLMASTPPGSGQPGDALTSYISALSGEIGTPIRVKQLLSGGSLVLEIDTSALSARIRDRLRAQPNVKQALAAPADPARPPASRIGFQVEFLEKSPEAAAVGKAASAGRESDPELQGIAASFTRQTGVSFIPAVSPARQLLLSVDLEAVTLDLVARLRKLAHVEYAQPNFLHRPMRRVDPGF
jgi:hypothetical protein